MSEFGDLRRLEAHSNQNWIERMWHRDEEISGQIRGEGREKSRWSAHHEARWRRPLWSF